VPANVGNGSGPRAALAEAIRARDAAQSDLAPAEQALELAGRAKWQATDELEEAETALAKARDDAGMALADSFIAGKRSNGHGLLRESRMRAVDAADHAAACEVAVRQLESAIPERQKAFERACYAVTLAARNVIRAEARDIASELKATLDRASSLRAELFWLFSNAALPDQPERRFESEGLPHLSDVSEDSDVAALLRSAQAGMAADGHIWRPRPR
jgi:hypothetical protein